MAGYTAERAFKGIWIPKEIWCSEKMTLQEKVFLAEIDSLDRGQGCYANNTYFAKFFDISKKRASFVINSLCKKGLVKSSVDVKAGNKRRLHPSTRFQGYPIPENGDTPPQKQGYPYPRKQGPYNKDKSFEKIKDNEKEFFQTGLSKTEDQERGHSLLLRYGIHAKTAKAIVYEQHTPVKSIEEVIKNGLAKQKYEPGFVLQPGYIVEALNRARAEGKVVGPTENSHKLKGEIKKLAASMAVPRIRLSPDELARRKVELLRQFDSEKNSQKILTTA